MNTIKVISKIDELEIKQGLVDSQGSWHNKFSGSSWIYVGGLRYELSEGDILAVFSECGEIMNINMIRDKITGKSKGFCFICYEDQRSTNLAINNLNGIKLVGRTIRVDHVENYELPKVRKEDDDVVRLFLYNHGCGPELDTAIKESQELSDEVKKKQHDMIDEMERRKQLRESGGGDREYKIKREPRGESDRPRRLEGHYRRSHSRERILVKRENLSPINSNRDRSRMNSKRDSPKRKSPRRSSNKDSPKRHRRS